MLDFLALQKREVLSLSKAAQSCVSAPLKSCITFPFVKWYEQDKVIPIEPQQLECDSIGLTLSYCVPLNVHSAFFTVRFNKDQSQATVDIKIHGSGLQSVYYPGLLARATMMVSAHQDGISLEGRPTLKYIENGESSPYCGMHVRLQVSATSMPQFMTQQLKEFMTEASGRVDVLLETRWERLVHNPDSFRFRELAGKLPEENICLRYLQHVLQEGSFDPALFSDSLELNNTLLNFMSIHPTYREHNALRLSIAVGQLAAIAGFMEATKAEPTITCLKDGAIAHLQPGTVRASDNVTYNAANHALKIIHATLPTLRKTEAAATLSFIKQCPEIKKYLPRAYQQLEPQLAEAIQLQDPRIDETILQTSFIDEKKVRQAYLQRLPVSSHLRDDHHRLPLASSTTPQHNSTVLPVSIKNKHVLVCEVPTQLIPQVTQCIQTLSIPVDKLNDLKPIRIGMCRCTNVCYFNVVYKHDFHNQPYQHARLQVDFSKNGGGLLYAYL